MKLLVLSVRKLRPYITIAVIVAVIARRLSAACAGVHPESFLELIVSVVQRLDIAPTTGSVFGSSSALLVAAFSLAMKLFQDILGLLLLASAIRFVYVLYHFSWRNDYQQSLQGAVFAWANHNIGAVAKKLDKESKTLVPKIEKSFNVNQFAETAILALPTQGKDPQAILENLQSHAAKEEQNWANGKVSGAVYVKPPSSLINFRGRTSSAVLSSNNPSSSDQQSTNDEHTYKHEHDHVAFLNQVYGLYSLANTLHPGIWPRLNQCETELIAMTANLLHSPNLCGCTTSGGTESIMLAIKAHWYFYGKQRGIRHPELVCGSTAHAAVDKACELFGIRKVCVDCTTTSDFTLDSKQVRRHISSNTIMIFASAPNYPQGTIDPIESLGELATSFGIGLHVDACLGGFVLPFAPPGTFPSFDFQVAGVTSMSADTHKFGYAPKGTSVVVYRSKALRHAQYFCYPHWTGGLYATPTFAGSRPSGLLGCAWAALVTIGRSGYEERTTELLQASKAIADGIQNDIPELEVIMGDQRPSMVVCFSGSSPKENVGNGQHAMDVYRVADAMKERGWSLNSLQNPASVHVCVTLGLAPKADEFLQDLKDSVAQIGAENPADAKKGTAGLYGMAGSVPEGPLNEILQTYLDIAITPGSN